VASVTRVHRAILDNAPISNRSTCDRDGDHLINIKRGCETLVALAQRSNRCRLAAFERIGKKLLATIGGASGPLIASFFLAMGKDLDGAMQPSSTQMAQAFPAGVDGDPQSRQGDLGEKRCSDVLIPVARLFLRLTQESANTGNVVRAAQGQEASAACWPRVTWCLQGAGVFSWGTLDRAHRPGSRLRQIAIAAVCDLLAGRHANGAYGANGTDSIPGAGFEGTAP